MQPYYSVLSQCPLFRSIKVEDFDHILSCLDIQVKRYEPDDYILLLGDRVDSIGILLEGSAEIVKENLAGNRHIVSILTPSSLFAEGIVCTSQRRSPVTVRTKTACSVLHIPYQKILVTCTNACGFHTQLIYNMMLLLGEKNYMLNHKIDLLMLKGMKEKLATYLLYEANRQDKESFVIDLNRNELAEYLNVSRPSMSRELARMKGAGLLDFHKNEFKILDYDALMACLDEF